MRQKDCRQVQEPVMNLIEDKCGGEKILTECLVIDRDFPEIDAHKGEPLMDVIQKLVELHKKNTIEISFYKKQIDKMHRQMNF